jgi:uncharacterized protein (DUF2147 family)
MKKSFVLAALLMATTAAHAGNSISFEIGGHKVHIETPRDCDSLSCIKVSAPGLSGFKDLKPARSQDKTDTALRTDPPAQKTVAAPAEPAPAPQTVAPANNAAPAAETIASVAPATAPKENAAPTAAPKTAPVAAAPAAAPTTPLGEWATEENKGRVRIEQCGENLCGVAADSGEKILINMRPSEARWSGRIHDPDSGKTYDSTMTMKGPNKLRIQGCAFGGMFCGGQTWNRIS